MVAVQENSQKAIIEVTSVGMAVFTFKNGSTSIGRKIILRQNPRLGKDEAALSGLSGLFPFQNVLF